MKNEIRYHLTDPTGNRTVLVETAIPVDEQPSVAAKLMQLEPTAEQVGFLGESQTADVALRMAGGEFCGNAAMSAAVLFACGTRQTDLTVTVAVSGAPEPVAVAVMARADGLWQGHVRMPRPQKAETVRFSDGQICPVVTFDGITHVVMESGMPAAEAEALARRRCAELSADALGLMFLDRANETLTPLVYVPRSDTLFWEHSCGSGTAAVGAYLAKEQGMRVCVSLRQPGGTLEITASPDGELYLAGTVRCVYERTAEIRE